MHIKRAPLNFHNVLSAKTRCDQNEWRTAARDLRNAIIRNGLYATGPVIYQVSNLDEAGNTADFTFYIPVNTPLEMPETDKYSFRETLHFDDGLVFRHADWDEDTSESVEIIKAVAEEYQFTLAEPFYYIYLDVYGGSIIDIYAPIIAGEGND